MKISHVLIAVLALTGAARAGGSLEDVQRAKKNLDDTIARMEKEQGVKPKNDGCDEDRILLKSSQKDLREKLDLSACKDQSGDERKACEQSARDDQKKSQAEAKEMIARSKARIACCEHKKKPGCDKILNPDR